MIDFYDPPPSPRQRLVAWLRDGGARFLFLIVFLVTGLVVLARLRRGQPPRDPHPGTPPP